MTDAAGPPLERLAGKTGKIENKEKHHEPAHGGPWTLARTPDVRP